MINFKFTNDKQSIFLLLIALLAIMSKSTSAEEHYIYKFDRDSKQLEQAIIEKTKCTFEKNKNNDLTYKDREARHIDQLQNKFFAHNNDIRKKIERVRFFHIFILKI